MKLARVIGNVVATRKEGNMDGLSMRIVSYLDGSLKDTGKTAACVDTVNAGVGDMVLLCSSSSARFTTLTRSTATDNTIVGIVDSVSLERKDVYNRASAGGKR